MVLGVVRFGETMKITLSALDISVLIWLLDAAIHETARQAAPEDVSPESLKQVAANTAYDTFSALRDRLEDLR